MEARYLKWTCCCLWNMLIKSHVKRFHHIQENFTYFFWFLLSSSSVKSFEALDSRFFCTVSLTFIVQLDSEPKRTTTVIINYRQRTERAVLQQTLWPPQSPDLIMASVWDHMKSQNKSSHLQRQLLHKHWCTGTFTVVQVWVLPHRCRH